MSRPIRPRRAAGRALAVGLALVLSATGLACGSEATASCEPVAIAFVGPLSGPNAGLGRPLRNGVALAVADHAARADAAARAGNTSADRCPIGLVELDTQGDPEQAVPIASQAVSQPDVVGVVGPSLSGETGAALPLFEQAGLVTITPSATNAELGAAGPLTFHRMVTTDATQGPAIARFLTAQLAITRVAVVDDGSLYGDGIADLVASALPALGGEVVVRRSVDPASRDYTAAVAEAQASGAEAVFFGGNDEPAARLVRQLRELGSDALFAAPDAALSSSFLASAGAAAADVVISCPCAPAAAGERAELRLFAARYLDAFGAAVGPFAPEAYDAATLLLHAVDEAGADREAVRRAVDRAELEGVTRTIRFDERGEVAEGPVYLYTVDGAAFRPIAEVVGSEVVLGG